MAVYRATFQCTHQAGPKLAPTLHYKTSPPPLGDEPDPSDVADAIWDLVASPLRSAASDWVTFDDLIVSEEVIAPDIGSAGVKHLAVPGLLAHGDAKVPTGMSPVINIHTNVRSRSARGWWHPPGPSASTQLDGNTWASSYITLLDALAAVLDDGADMGTITTTRLTPVVYSRKRHELGENPYTFDVKGATVNHTPKWLRSRMTTP